MAEDPECPLRGRCPIRPHTLVGKEAEQELMDGTKCRVVDEYGYINLKFQLGPVNEHGQNGTTIEAVIDVLVSRLRGFEKGPFACEHNRQAILSLLMAKGHLQARTTERQARGVEGTNQP